MTEATARSHHTLKDAREPKDARLRELSNKKDSNKHGRIRELANRNGKRHKDGRGRRLANEKGDGCKDGRVRGCGK